MSYAKRRACSRKTQADDGLISKFNHAYQKSRAKQQKAKAKRDAKYAKYRAFKNAKAKLFGLIYEAIFGPDEVGGLPIPEEKKWELYFFATEKAYFEELLPAENPQEKVHELIRQVQSWAPLMLSSGDVC